MNLIEKIEAELKAAMKNGDTLRAETLKMLKSDLTYEKAKTGKDLSEQQMLEVLSRAAKRRREAIAEFKKGNRSDLAEKEEKELAIVDEFLPAQMSEDEIAAAIEAKLAAIGSYTQKDAGRIMGELMKELKGKADGSVVKAFLTKRLEGK